MMNKAQKPSNSGDLGFCKQETVQEVRFNKNGKKELLNKEILKYKK
jgi:hypothetical protein